MPRLVDPLWHAVDQPKNEEAELTALEKMYDERLEAIAKGSKDVTPIGNDRGSPSCFNVGKCPSLWPLIMTFVHRKDHPGGD